MKQMVLYTDRSLDDPEMSKTAYGILRFRSEDVVGVVDHNFAGKRLGDVCKMPGLPNIPIVGDVRSAPLPAAFVIGFAPVGGVLTESQCRECRSAMEQGRKVINGLHQLLPRSPQVRNLREFNPSEKWIAKGAALHSTRILTVGTSHSIGKMTATIKIHEALRSGGIRSDWVATGQTGVILRGAGRVIDAIPIDFVPGHVERLVLEAERAADIVVVEGQGSMFHPSYSPTSLALLHAVRPNFLVMCHRLGQKEVWGFPGLSCRRFPRRSSSISICPAFMDGTPGYCRSHWIRLE